jgi:predicted dehydrogenase
MTTQLRVAFVGARRASSFLRAFQSHPETKLSALCDVHEPTLQALGQSTGIDALYTNYEQMLDEAKPDIVVIATPMQFHATQAIAALDRDIHVLSEVTAAVSVDECRWLVDACRRSRAIYMMAENYIYRKSCALISALVQAGLFGETYYAEGEYLHELSVLHHTPAGKPTWRYFWQVGINGSTYPTHSLGPCLQWIGERPARISCIGTGRWTDPEHALEDTTLLLCKTASEKLIKIRLDMLSRRPHAMTNYALQGTKGAFESARHDGGEDRIWLADLHEDPNQWHPLSTLEAEFLPEMWRNPPQAALQAGHGGGDYFEVMDFIDAVRGRKAPTIGIHEALDMTLPGLISQESIRQGGEWLPVPDSRTW